MWHVPIVYQTITDQMAAPRTHRRWRTGQHSTQTRPLECGFLKRIDQVQVEDVPLIVKTVCKEYTMLRCSHEIQLFRLGLDTLEVVSLLKDHSSSLNQLFIHDKSLNLTWSKVASLFKPVFSPVGSNLTHSGLLRTGATVFVCKMGMKQLVIVWL